MRPLQISLATLLLLTLLAVLSPAQTLRIAATHPAPKLRVFTTPYYIMHTDLDDDGAREAWMRMTKMFETYKRRTAGFSGDIRERFPFYLYKNEDDYIAAGGPPDSAGVFIHGGGEGPRLMAIVGEKPDADTWHVIQHEAFHQFAYAVIRGNLPTWLNEGMAEYFGEALYTGDDFVTGVISPDRLETIKFDLRHKQFFTIKDIMRMTSDQWTSDLEESNYDEAWSMVQFLAHADDGKYQKPFIAYMNLIAAGRNADDAWKAIFGADIAAFQKKWEQWWLAQNPLGTLGLYQQATLMTLTGYLGRAASQGQTFASADAFLDAAEKGTLKFNREDWLPPSLLQRALHNRPILGDLKLEPAQAGHPLRLVATPDEGGQIAASFTLSGTRIRTVTFEVLKAAPQPAATTTTPAYERVRE